MKRILLRSPAFVRSARRLVKVNPQIAEDLSAALRLIEADAFDSRLRTHKLKGDLEGTWSCSVTREIRIVFEFLVANGAESILLHTVGTHDEVY